jgi:hypothetical protein
MAAKFKMATKTKFADVAKKLSFDFWPIQLSDFIDFELKKKKNIWKLQNQIWLLNSRWPLKIDLLLKSKVMFRNGTTIR